MAYKLVETALAQADLDAILSYLALSLENPTAATAFANEVEKCYTALEQMPYLYEQCRDPRLSSKGYRKAVIKHYLLIYRVDEAQRLFTCFDSSMAVKITKHCYNTKPPTRMSGRFYYAQL